MRCDFSAVIGKGWIDARDETNKKRLDNPDDFVRIELTSALEQDKRVIPVLVGDAQMPRVDDLPDVLKPLAMRNAVRLTHERFRADLDGLIKALERALEQAEGQRRLQEAAALQAPTQERHDQAERIAAAQRAQEAGDEHRAEDQQEQVGKPKELEVAAGRDAGELAEPSWMAIADDRGLQPTVVGTEKQPRRAIWVGGNSRRKTVFGALMVIALVAIGAFVYFSSQMDAPKNAAADAGLITQHR